MTEGLEQTGCVFSVVIIDCLDYGGVVTSDVFCVSLFMESKMYSPVPFWEGGLVSEGCDPEA